MRILKILLCLKIKINKSFCVRACVCVCERDSIILVLWKLIQKPDNSLYSKM